MSAPFQSDDTERTDGLGKVGPANPITSEFDILEGDMEEFVSPAEERRVVRKYSTRQCQVVAAVVQLTVACRLDCILMPILVAGFFVLQLDRNNISNAMTDSLAPDLGITKDDVNLGNQLQLIGIIVAEIPSNLVLQKVGAHIWLTAQLLLWGAIALGQSWITGKSSFYATRFLLGLFEAGYIPGAQYILALFYKPEELALRTAVFYFGNYLATATGSLIAAGVLQMGGLEGMAGWRWLFLGE